MRSKLVSLALVTAAALAVIATDTVVLADPGWSAPKPQALLDPGWS